MAHKITLGTDVFSTDRNGQSHESVVVICDDQDAASRALHHVADRAMNVDETGVENSPSAPRPDAYMPNYAGVEPQHWTGLGPSIYVDCKGSISTPMGKAFRKILTDELHAEPTLQKVRVITEEAASKRVQAKRRRALAKAAKNANPREVGRRALETSHNIAMVNTDFTTNADLEEDISELRQRGWNVETVDVAKFYYVDKISQPDIVVLCGNARRLLTEQQRFDHTKGDSYHEDANGLIQHWNHRVLSLWVEPGEGPVNRRLAESENVHVVTDVSIADVAREFDIRARDVPDRELGAELLKRALSVVLIHDDATLEDALAAQAELQRQGCVAKLWPTSWIDALHEAELAFDDLMANRKLDTEAARNSYRIAADAAMHRNEVARGRLGAGGKITVIYALPKSGFATGRGIAVNVWLQPGIELETLSWEALGHDYTKRSHWPPAEPRWVQGVDIREVARDIRLGRVP